jgi:hypothetical protein
MNTQNRRNFIKRSAGIGLSLPFLTSFTGTLQDKQYPRILFRLGWDFKDNNDIAYIPSLYRLAQKNIMNTEFYLWLKDSDNGVLEMLNTNFVNVKIVKGEIDASGQPTTDELRTILSESDLLIYSPGAVTMVDWANNGEDGIETRSLQYCFENQIPYAIMGIGEIPEDGPAQERFLKLANGANYIYSTSSLIDKKLKEGNIKISKLQTSPNPLFAFDLRSDFPSRKILETYNLLDKDFLCIEFRAFGFAEEEVKNYSQKIVSLISAWVKSTDKHVLILPIHPEDIDPTIKYIYKPLPADIITKVVFLQEKVMPDLAASIYEKSRIVSSMSLFPACSAIQAGIPVFFLSTLDISTRSKTIEDMGLKNSIQELDSKTDEELVEILLEIDKKYVAGMIESGKAREFAIKKLSAQFDDINRYINKLAEKMDSSEKKEKKKKKKGE